jgi:hypothetical protein
MSGAPADFDCAGVTIKPVDFFTTFTMNSTMAFENRSATNRWRQMAGDKSMATNRWRIALEEITTHAIIIAGPSALAHHCFGSVNPAPANSARTCESEITSW